MSQETQLRKLVAKKKSKDKKIKVISLFSGCGGMDLGFEGGFSVLNKSVNKKVHPDWLVNKGHKSWVKLPKTRFETIFANDIVRAAKAAWEPHFNYKDERFHLDSIVDLVKKHQNGEKVFPKADVVTGGFPCQDFSVAGKRKGFNSHKGHHGDLLTDIDDPSEENRGKLYMWMKRVIEIVLPKVFIAENVKGLVTLTDTKKIIENDFRNIGSGYVVIDAKLLYAPDFGIPQSRERVFFIGFRKDALKKTALTQLSNSIIHPDFDPYPKVTHSANGKRYSTTCDLLPYTTVSNYLSDLPEPYQSDDLAHQSYSKAKWYGRHCQGQTEVKLQGVGPTIRAEHHGNIEFRRLSLENGGRYKEELESGLEERRLSVRECARIQTFPDDFEFVRQAAKKNDELKISASEGYKLIGNAVPPLLAFHIAWRLQELWPKIMKK